MVWRLEESACMGTTFMVVKWQVGQERLLWIWLVVKWQEWKKWWLQLLWRLVWPAFMGSAFMVVKWQVWQERLKRMGKQR